MPHDYTRQRQGHDFSLQQYLIEAAEAHRKDAENVKKFEIVNKTLADRLEHHKKEAERSKRDKSAPVDGHEPLPEPPATKGGRNII
jgi:hypothetical protein